MGPLQVLVLGLEDFRAMDKVAEELAALNDAGIVRIVDARFLFEEGEEDPVVARLTNLDATEREDILVAADALIDRGVAAIPSDQHRAAEGAVLTADAAAGVGEIGLSAEEVAALGSEMELGDALLLLVVENVWAIGLRDSLRDAGLVRAKQGYLTSQGLAALGAMLGTEPTMENAGREGGQL